MFEFPFMQRALIAALLIGVLCGVLSFFVVLRRLAFVGVGLSHAALGGVALAALLGVAPLVGGGVFALVGALGIAWSERRAAIAPDTAMGILFAGSMGLAVVLFSLRPGSNPDLFAALFGNVLAVSGSELTGLAAVLIVTLALIAWLFRRFLLVAFDPEVALAYGHPVATLDATLLGLLALVVVLGVHLVGVVLVEALLVVPAATAGLWAAHYRSQVLLSSLIGAGAGACGLIFSYLADLPAGASMALTLVALFLLSLVASRLRRP